MSSTHPPENPNGRPEEPADVTVSFPDFHPGADLPETTMAFGAAADDMPEAGDFPSAVLYSVREEVGRGGMAKIYSATDAGLNRLVAVKVSTAGNSGSDVQFLREAEVLANLAHPSIPPIHTRGTDEMGRVFYAMKLIRGQTLQKILKLLASADKEATATYTLQRFLEIFRKVCDAVAFAHAKGYLHRDLKPENIMVGEFGEVLVMDWGLALPLKEESPPKLPSDPNAPEGETGMICLQGTPQYMSPEQAEGLIDGLDERSDVYSLGGVLYAILTTNSPVSGTSLEEVLDRVRHGKIAPPPRVRMIGSGSGKIETPIPEALCAVTMKAMATDRNDRYPHVSDLISDIEAFQSGYATQAEQAGLARQLVLLVKRNRVASVMASLLLIVAVAFTIRLAQSEKLSRLRAIEAQENAAAALAEKKAARRSAADAQMAVAEFSERENNFSDLRRALQAVPEELRDQAWNYLEDRLNGNAITIVSKNGAPWLAVRPNGKKEGVVAALETDGNLRSVDLNTGEMRDVIKLDPTGIPPQILALSADGSTVSITRKLPKPKTSPANAPNLQNIEAYDTSSGQLKYAIPTPHESDLVIFNDTGDFFGRSSYAAGGGFAIHDATNGSRLWEKQGLGFFIPWFSESGDTVHLFTSKMGYLQFDVRTGQNKAAPISAVYPNIVEGPRSISVSPPGTDAFLPSKEGFDLVDIRTGKLRYNVQLPLGKVAFKGIDADWSNQFLYTGFRKTEHEVVLQILSTRDGRKIHSFGFLIPDFIKSLNIFLHPESKHLVAVSDKYIKAWSVKPAVGFKRFELSPRPPTSIAQGFCFLEGSNRCLAYLLKNHGKFLTVHDLDPDSVEETPFEAAGQINGNFGVTLSASLDGRIVSVANMSANNKQILHLYENQNGAFKLLVKKDMDVIRNRYQMAPLHLSPAAKTIWHAGVFRELNTLKGACWTDRSGYLAIEDNANARWVGESHIVEIAIPQQAYSPVDEDSPDRVLLLSSATGGKPITITSSPQAIGLAAAPDGSQIAEAGKDLRLRIRDSSTLKVVREIRTHDAPLTSVAWHPRLPYVATASEDHSVKIWDLRTDKLVRKIGLFTGIPNALYWSPDGKTLAVQSAEASYFVDLFKIDCCNE